MFQVQEDNKFKPQTISNILLRNTQSILDQTQIIHEQEQSPQVSSKSLVNNFKSRLKALLHQKDIIRTQTIKQRDPRCYNIKSPAVPKINNRIKLNSESMKQKLEIMVKDLHLLLEPKINSSPKYETEQTVIVTLIKLRDEFKYLCQDYNDFYSNNQAQNIDPNFYYDFLKDMLREVIQRPSLKNNKSVFDDFVNERSDLNEIVDPIQILEEEEVQEIVEIVPVEEVEIVIIEIPIPIPPPLPQIKIKVMPTTITPKQAPKPPNTNPIPIVKSQPKNKKQKEPRGKKISFSGMEKTKKQPKKKKKNVQQNMPEVAIGSKNRYSQSSSGADEFNTGRFSRRNKIQEVHTESDVPTPSKSNVRSRQSFVSEIPKKQLPRKSQLLQQLEQLETPQEHIPLLSSQTSSQSQIPILASNAHTPIFKKRPIPVYQQEAINEQSKSIDQSKIEDQEEIQIQVKVEKIIQPKINVPIVPRQQIQMIPKRISPFKYQDQKSIENQLSMKQIAQQMMLMQQLEGAKLQGYKADLFDIMIECDDIFQLNLNEFRIEEIHIKNGIHKWLDDMETIVDGLDIFEVGL